MFSCYLSISVVRKLKCVIYFNFISSDFTQSKAVFECMAFIQVSPLIEDYLVMDLRICSLNVRGLGERLKRRETFNWLRAKKFSIYLLQETPLF